MSKLAKTYDLSGLDSVEAMLETSATNWDIQVVPATGPGFNSGGFSALVRPDTHDALSFVSSRFRPNNHRKQLAPLDAFIREGRLQPVSASVWDNGSIIAYQIRCPELDVNILGKDIVSPLLTLVFGYGFKIADSAFFADFRWFCKNQMGKVSQLMTDRVRHRGETVANYAGVLGQRIGELRGELAGHYEVMRLMPGVELEGRMLNSYIGRSLGLEDAEIIQAWNTPVKELRGNAAKVPEVLECYREDDCGAPGTVWHAYNAVTRYTTHKDGRTPENRTRSMLLGAGNKVASSAFECAKELVTA